MRKIKEKKTKKWKKTDEKKIIMRKMENKKT